jgi:hypothetical protein
MTYLGGCDCCYLNFVVQNIHRGYLFIHPTSPDSHDLFLDPPLIFLFLKNDPPGILARTNEALFYFPFGRGSGNTL